MPEPCRAAIRSALWRHWVTAPLGLHPALGLLGPVPRHTAFEDTGGSFWLDARGRMPDLIHDDLSLWIDTPEGLLLLTGCCHAGIINTVQRARDVTGREHIALVLGGLHLQQASDSRMEQTLHGLEACGCRTVMPCHCTGEEAIRILQHRFPHGLRQAGAGAVLEFGH